jgi:hypothetical protein
LSERIGESVLSFCLSLKPEEAQPVTSEERNLGTHIALKQTRGTWVIIRTKPTTLAMVTMLLLGAISLIAAISYDSLPLAFIGLGLAFWGAILLYIRPEEYTKKALLEAALSPSLITLNQMIQELGYKGDTTYLPPKYFKNPETTKLYISKYKNGTLPTPEQTQLYEDQHITRTTQGMLLTPPGIQLAELLEKSLGKSFTRTDLKNLQQNLPKLFMENLEIAENLELQAENDTTQNKEDHQASPAQTKNTTIHAKITRPIYGTTLKEAEEPSQTAAPIGCPVCSAIAIAITKATGKPVRITETKSSEDINTVEASYEIIEE